MRRFIRSGVFAAFALALVVSAGGVFGDDKDKPKEGAKAKPRHFAVEMTGANKFDPEEFEINVGDTVVWINRSGVTHTATPTKTSEVTFEAVEVEKGKFSKRVTFDKAGKVDYFCEHHPGGMKGKITVKP